VGIYSEYHRMQDEVIERAASYPAFRFKGRGIVTCAGGPRYFTCVWVLVRVLRDVIGTKLPIEVWHRGPMEIDPLMRALLERFGVEVVDASAIESHPMPSERWALKPFAILHSRFQEVVFLDADNVPAIDPARLFALKPYRATGAVFWPDLHPIPEESPIWEICRVPYRDEPSFESGQMVLDKARCWKALLLTMHMNEHAGLYYQHVLGDKDTFHMAWRLLQQPYSMVPYPLRLICAAPDDPLFVHVSFVLGQRDFEGRVILQHRNWPKFILYGKNPRYPGFVYEKECLRFLDELAPLWNGRVATLELQLPEGYSLNLGARWFRYVQISNHDRLIEFLPDQRIGYGGSRRERMWRMIPEGAASVLEILGEECITCRLTRQQDGVWRGRWLRYERSPVELIPWPS
jgi:Mannosyltransferase putative